MVNKFGEGRVFVVGGKNLAVFVAQYLRTDLSSKTLLMPTVPLEDR